MPEARSWAMEVFDRWRLYRQSQVATQQPIPNRELASLVLNRKDGMRKVRRIGMILVTKSVDGITLCVVNNILTTHYPHTTPPPLLNDK